MAQETVVLVSIAFAGLLLCLKLLLERNKLHSPPGPRGLPIIGVPHKMPKQQEWATYDAWTKKYGPFISMNVLGHSIAIIASTELTHELLEKRSAIYSDRPKSAMLDMAGHGEWNIGLFQSTPKLRACRRFLTQSLGPHSVSDFQPVQERTTKVLLQKLLEDPENFDELVRRSVVSTIMKILFGYDVASEGEDECVRIVDENATTSTRAASPAAYLVNTFPILRFLPKWFPGAGFKTEARKGKEIGDRVFKLPRDLIEDQQARGLSIPSIVSNWFAQDTDPAHRANVQAASATSYGAGVETTASTLLTFIMAMAKYPAAQRSAQAEIDRVIGSGRLPNLDDKRAESLPYMEAVMKETLRWHPAGPIGLPHALSKDDIYNGYFLPKGTVVIPNVWTMVRDPEVYHNPDQFIPERFLGDPEKVEADPRVHTFGYGRRVCPGRLFAEASLWLSMTSILAVFDISLARDADGKEIPIKEAFTSGIMSRPELFPCRIVPRSKASEDLIRQNSELL